MLIFLPIWIFHPGEKNHRGLSRGPGRCPELQMRKAVISALARAHISVYKYKAVGSKSNLESTGSTLEG